MNTKKISNSLLRSIKSSDGFTLMEIVVVVIIIGILSLIAMQNFSKSVERDRLDATIQELEMLKIAIVGDPDKITDGIRTDFGYVGDNGSPPASLNDLVNPGGVSYVDVNFADANDYLTDAFGQSYTYSAENLTIRSEGIPGANDPITIQLAESSADLTSNTVYLLLTDRNGWTPSQTDISDSISVYIKKQSSSSFVDISSDPSLSIDSSGLCTITGVHIGNHFIRVNYGAYQSVTKRVSVLPGSQPAPVEIIFGSFAQ